LGDHESRGEKKNEADYCRDRRTVLVYYIFKSFADRNALLSYIEAEVLLCNELVLRRPLCISKCKVTSSWETDRNKGKRFHGFLLTLTIAFYRVPVRRLFTGPKHR